MDSEDTVEKLDIIDIEEVHDINVSLNVIYYSFSLISSSYVSV